MTTPKNATSRSLFKPLMAKTFESAVLQFLEQEFPHLTGPLTRKTFVEALQNLIEQFYPATSHIKAGQMLWIAVATEDRPGYGKSMTHTRLVPVVLSLVTQEDLSCLCAGEDFASLRTQVVARILREAFDQGGVLAETDLSVILKISRTMITKAALQYEQDHHVSLPRRGNVHDMGATQSHKRAILQKIKVEGKSPLQVARETMHSPEAIDRYLSDLERIRFCLEKGLSVDSTAFVTRLSKKLVVEYQGIIHQMTASASTERIAAAPSASPE
jgi:hypothetical protein